MRNLTTILITAILAFLLGLSVFWGFSRSSIAETRTEATVLLEQIRKVTKLVTVEGDVSEIYHSTKTRNVTLYLPLPAHLRFDKEATVQVQGKVLVGYDLEQLRIDVDDAARTVTLSNLPEPTILAIDHELTYRNLEESWFNSFTAEDYSALNKEAKERLRNEALRSKLMGEARLEGNGIIETIRFLVTAAGYSFVLEGEEVRELGTRN
jgi:hypothetical protein